MLERNKRRSQENTIKNNYFMLLFMSGYFDKLITTINETQNEEKEKILESQLIKLYASKKVIFKRQMKNEREMGQKYIFTSADDLFYDKFFYFYGLKYNIPEKLPIIYVDGYEKAQEKPEKTDKVVNPVSTYTQNIFELELKMII